MSGWWWWYHNDVWSLHICCVVLLLLFLLLCLEGLKSTNAMKISFVSKKEREKQQANAAQQAEVERRTHEDVQSRKRKEFLMQEELERERDRRDKQREREEERRKRDDERRLKEEAERQRRSTNERHSNTYSGGDKRRRVEEVSQSSLLELEMLNLPETEVRARQQMKELEQIRSHYLGMTKEKKKIQKPSEKFRNIFNFEWDASEDTGRGDNNPLYQHRVEPQLLFGRGYRAGIDIREQRKHNNFYDELVRRRGDAPDGGTAVVTTAPKSLGVTATGVTTSSNNSQQPDDTKQTKVEIDKSSMDHVISKSRDLEAGDPHKKHWTEKTVEQMSERDWRIFREDFEIYLKGGRVPPPSRTWAESPLPWELIQAVNKAGYERPTPIQMQAISIAAEMRDLIGIAETGSGKTAAFVLPMLMYVKTLPALNDETSQDGPYALILAPSRELALQIDEETNKFASFCKCRTVAVVGGRSAEAQAFELRRGVEIVIGTPGRVKDSLERAYTVLNQCNYIVLDEADRMIDMGFEEVVNCILDMIPTSSLKSEDEALALEQEMQAKAGHRRYRITQMFSATMPPAVERLARKYLRAPAYISIGDPGAGKRAIEQKLEFMAEGKKKQRLQEVVEAAEPPVIVFVNQKKVADVLAKALNKMGFRAGSLHGGKAQENRESAMASFKAGEVDILCATDVAGRGIDVDGVQLVINFDMPKDIETYTHRIGRTGRAGKKGEAVSFVKEEDNVLFYDLKNLLLSTNNIVPLELANHSASKVKPGSVGAGVDKKSASVVYKS
eukprot:GHVS01104341.1.p1 GENE.GHVS01104341.1~~GHVS01104341.1.p1  ORF type:complete len:785 (-),score=149.12 GHVS01104341.1:265-2619(-)